MGRRRLWNVCNCTKTLMIRSGSTGKSKHTHKTHTRASHGKTGWGIETQLSVKPGASRQSRCTVIPSSHAAPGQQGFQQHHQRACQRTDGHCQVPQAGSGRGCCKLNVFSICPLSGSVQLCFLSPNIWSTSSHPV